ncbi:MAG: 3'-5' exonuclease, partial [Leeuwenhoekiella sp.]
RNQDLLPEHFKGKYLPNALERIAQGNLSLNLESAWVKNLGQEDLYAKTQKPDIKAVLDRIKPDISADFEVLKTKILKLSLTIELLKKITPLSVLQAINTEVQKIKAEKNLVLISDFNELIHTNIANQPTPFIYERLGERYHHYFIDEFQDTSVLQWENMIPLIDNTVSSEKKDDISNSLMLVGDPKQAIYRWRGGYAEQFIKLSGDHNPFQNQNKTTIDLEFNYRSHSEIIAFNNSFFTTASVCMEQPAYLNMYIAGNKQKNNSKQGGFVSISFVQGNTKEEALPEYLEQTLKHLNEIKKDFALSEICILVRKNDEGVAIAQYLQENDIPVVSNESLLINQSAEVCFIVDILHYILQPDSTEICIRILEYLALTYLEINEPHNFYVEHLQLEGQDLFTKLARFGIAFNLDRCTQLPLYEAAEYIVRSFDLTQGGAHIQFFLDSVFDYDQKNEAGVHGFIEWWEKNKQRLSISTPPFTEAVQIMTIHKAKGLEFPVVIYPFVESDLYPKSDNTNWYMTEPEEYLGFETLLIGQKKDLLQIDENTAELYHAKRQQQQLDNVNILYVALTRAVEQLYIISRSTEKSKPTDDPKNFGDLLINFLDSKKLWNSTDLLYKFGDFSRISLPNNNSQTDQVLNLISTAK